jgi:hypothetical protein
MLGCRLCVEILRLPLWEKKRGLELPIGLEYALLENKFSWKQANSVNMKYTKNE